MLKTSPRHVNSPASMCVHCNLLHARDRPYFYKGQMHSGVAVADFDVLLTRLSAMLSNSSHVAPNSAT